MHLLRWVDLQLNSLGNWKKITELGMPVLWQEADSLEQHTQKEFKMAQQKREAVRAEWLSLAVYFSKGLIWQG